LPAAGFIASCGFLFFSLLSSSQYESTLTTRHWPSHDLQTPAPTGSPQKASSHFPQFIPLSLMEPVQNQVNYAELEAEAAKLDAGAVQQAANALTAQGLALDLSKVCDIYKKVRPFLAIAAKIPFLKGPITAFMTGLDLICP
jgi:hypothetical protein